MSLFSEWVCVKNVKMSEPVGELLVILLSFAFVGILNVIVDDKLDK